jgi:hypothetical protein
LVRRSIKYGLIALVVAFVVIQAVPYGRTSGNPPVIAEPEWDIQATRDLAVRACFDCHSNEVKYPWYARIAPVSWWTQNHIDEGRDELNFSEWSWDYDEIEEIAESVMDGEMPPNYYTILPGSRNLSEREKENLIRGLISTFNYSPNARLDSGEEDEVDDD